MKLSHFQLALQGFVYSPLSGEAKEAPRRLEICKAATGGRKPQQVPESERTAVLDDVIDRAKRPEVPFSAQVQSFIGKVS